MLKKIKVPLIIQFCQGKYSLSLDMFWTHFVFQENEHFIY